MNLRKVNKKIFATLIAIVMLVNSSFAYTLTVIRGPLTLTNSGILEGETINFNLRKVADPTISITGGATITDSKFTMPASDVTITITNGNVNEPLLGDGMVAVNWSNGEWVDTSEDDWDYNYTKASAWDITKPLTGDGTAKWANARTSDGSLYVWIPRFTYYVDAGNSVSWNADTAGTAKTYILFSDGVQDYVTDPTGQTAYSYTTHSAFRPGGNEITGFWIAKFEASNVSSKPTSKPGVVSWRSISLNNAYSTCLNLNTTLGSHLTKDDEWGAVAYLTSAIGRIPYINNNSNYYTGVAGESQNAASLAAVSNAWNSKQGTRASTTHNIYGVYDMSGGAYEWVSAFYTGYHTGYSSYMTNLINSANTDGNKYVNAYTSTSPTGDNAVYSWDSDAKLSFGGGGNSWYNNTYYAYDRAAIWMRGGVFSQGSSAGVYSAFNWTGYEYYNSFSATDYCVNGGACVYVGFRVALWGQSL